MPPSRAPMQALFRMVMAVDKAIALVSRAPELEGGGFHHARECPWRKEAWPAVLGEVGSCFCAPVPFWLEGRLRRPGGLPR